MKSCRTEESHYDCEWILCPFLYGLKTCLTLIALTLTQELICDMLSRSYASSHPRAPVVVLVSQSAAHISLRKQFRPSSLYFKWTAFGSVRYSGNSSAVNCIVLIIKYCIYKKYIFYKIQLCNRCYLNWNTRSLVGARLWSELSSNFVIYLSNYYTSWL